MNICTQGGETGFRRGDLGVSLFIQENGRFAVVGVASWRDGWSARPYVYGRVTAREDWIQENSNGTQYSNCTNEPVSVTENPTLTTLQSNSDVDSLQVELVVGVSAAALVLAAIIIAGVCCWQMDKCSCWRKDSEVMEENEMYGEGDYAQYDKDAYDTKIVDDNDYYGGEM